MAKFHRVASGWKKSKNGKEYVSLSTGGPNKAKIRIELEDGSQYECGGFMLYQNDHKKMEKHPDYNLVFITED